MTTSSTATGRPTTTPLRYPDRMSADRADVLAILDEALVCHVSYVLDGRPWVLPTLHARDGDQLLLHGSSGSRLALAARDGGVDVSVAVTLLDGVVLARAAFHHSINYRSVVVHGRAMPVTDPAAKSAALDAFVNQVIPGRSAECRGATEKELAASAVLALSLETAGAKIRDGAPSDDPEDLDLPHWAGVIPLSVTAAAAEPAPELVDAEIPAHVRNWSVNR